MTTNLTFLAANLGTIFAVGFAVLIVASALIVRARAR
jgi:hypothetical protein